MRHGRVIIGLLTEIGYSLTQRGPLSVILDQWQHTRVGITDDGIISFRNWSDWGFPSVFLSAAHSFIPRGSCWGGHGFETERATQSLLLFSSFFFCIFSGLVSADYTSFSPCRIRSTAKSPRCVACGGGSCQWWPPGALKTFTRQQKKKPNLSQPNLLSQIPKQQIWEYWRYSALVPKPATGGAGVDFHFIRKKISIVPNFVIRKDFTFSRLVPNMATSGAVVENQKIVPNRQIRAHTVWRLMRTIPTDGARVGVD